MTEIEMRTEIAELKRERDALVQQIAGDPSLSLFFYQRKSLRQSRVLDQLNRRIVNQRFVLRTLEELGRGLSREEWLEARAALQNPQLRERIEIPA